MDVDNLLIHVNHGLTSGKTIQNCAILCRDGKIFSVGGASAFKDSIHKFRIDLPDCYAVPGFIDPHIYGFKGHSIMEGNTIEAVNEIAKLLPRHGVTTFMPTLRATTISQELNILSALNNIEIEHGARTAGIHMVGPFINAAKRGANPMKGIRPFDEGELQESSKQLVAL